MLLVTFVADVDADVDAHAGGDAVAVARVGMNAAGDAEVDDLCVW